jgi:hypothetical protein
VTGKPNVPAAGHPIGCPVLSLGVSTGVGQYRKQDSGICGHSIPNLEILVDLFTLDKTLDEPWKAARIEPLVAIDDLLNCPPSATTGR